MHGKWMGLRLPEGTLPFALVGWSLPVGNLESLHSVVVLLDGSGVQI